MGIGLCAWDQVGYKLQEMIGIIIPPGEIKKMVEKTAAHVAKNGSEFEQALIEIEQNKPEFSFLKRENPYRAYYDHMVAEYSRKLIAQNDEEVKETPKQEEAHAKLQPELVENPQQAQFLQRIFEQVKQPEPDRFTAEIPEKLTKMDMSMIMHTAQFVALNGKNFLIALSEREKNNPQFQFLRSSSDNNQYFKKLVDAYSHILKLGEKDLNRLQGYIESKDNIFQTCKQDYEYYRVKQEESKGAKNKEQAKTEINVDWNDFDLVETIIFDDFKPRAGYSEEFKLNKPLFSNRNMEEKIISEPKKKELLQKCHICQRNILSTEMTKHLKTCLSSTEGTAKNSVPSQYGDSVDVTQNLKNMSMQRPDIFGGKGQNIRKEEENKQGKEEKILWDGQAPNITRGTATSVMLKNEQNKLKQAEAKK